MDFNYRKFSHFFALILVVISLVIIIVLPTMAFFGLYPSITDMSYYTKAISDIFYVIYSLFLAFILMIFFPLIWFILVNNCSMKEAFHRLRLTFENIDKAFLWGILTAILILIVFFIISFIFVVVLKYDAQELSNVDELQAYFSPAALILLVAIQPIAEEIFFRGFLLKKFESFAGTTMAILLTSVLFGLAHGSYNELAPLLLPMIMGVFLGYAAIKTKNLFASIIAHFCYNVIILILALLAGSLS